MFEIHNFCHNLATWQVVSDEVVNLLVLLYHSQLATWVSCGKVVILVLFICYWYGTNQPTIFIPLLITHYMGKL